MDCSLPGSSVHGITQAPNPGIKSMSPVSPALAGKFFTPEPPGKPWKLVNCTVHSNYVLKQYIAILYMEYLTLGLSTQWPYSHVSMYRKCVVLSLQSCPTLCHPVDLSPPDSSVHRILQAKYWSGSPYPPPGDLPNPGIKPRSPSLQADSLSAEPQRKPY